MMFAIDILEQCYKILISFIADSAQHSSHGDLSLSIDLYRYHVLAASLELQPGAALRNKLGKTKLAPGGHILLQGEIAPG